MHAEPEYLINGSEWGIDPQDRPQRASLSNLIIDDPYETEVEMDVEIVFDDVTDEITLPKFKPV